MSPLRVVTGIDFLRQLLITDPKDRMSVSASSFSPSNCLNRPDFIPRQPEDALKHPWLATEVQHDGALPLRVPNLPYNDPSAANADAGPSLSAPFGLDTPSLTSAAVSAEDSFGYSQRLGLSPIPRPVLSSYLLIYF